MLDTGAQDVKGSRALEFAEDDVLEFGEPALGDEPRFIFRPTFAGARGVHRHDTIFFVDVLNADPVHVDGDLALNLLNIFVAPAQVTVLVVEDDDNFFADVSDFFHAAIIFSLLVRARRAHDEQNDIGFF